jgi:hypothetical protein
MDYLLILLHLDPRPGPAAFDLDLLLVLFDFGSFLALPFSFIKSSSFQRSMVSLFGQRFIRIV